MADEVVMAENPASAAFLKFAGIKGELLVEAWSVVWTVRACGKLVSERRFKQKGRALLTPAVRRKEVAVNRCFDETSL